MINRYTCNTSQLPIFINKLKKNNTPPIIDFIKEKYEIDNVYKILESIRLYPDNMFAVKLSSIGIHNNVSDCYYNLEKIIDMTIQNNSKILIDSEEHDIQHKIDDITNSIIPIYNNKNVNVYKTYQMYKKKSLEELSQELTISRNYYLGIKLVRGDYLHKDKYKNVLCKNQDETDYQYNQAILNFSYISKKKDILMCATHNEKSIKIAKSMSDHSTQLQFSQLLGMSDTLTQELANNDFKVYKYLPYGNFSDSVPYLFRRLLENHNMIKYLF